MSLTYLGNGDKEFFVRASKLYKEASFNECPKHGLTMEAIQWDQGLLNFLLPSKASTFDEVKEMCLWYAEHQKVYSFPKKVSGSTPCVLDVGTHNELQGIFLHALDKKYIPCKKFEDLV